MMNVLTSLKMEGFVSAKDISQALGIAENTVRYWLHTGVLPEPTLRHQRRNYWKEDEVMPHIMAHAKALSAGFRARYTGRKANEIFMKQEVKNDRKTS